MNCNKDIHDELKKSGDIVCPFCDQNLDSNEKPKKMIYVVIISILLTTMGC